MKKILCVCLLFMLQLSIIHGDSYCVLLDGDNTVVDEKDMNKPQSVASISKIMTALIAIEKGNLDDTWTCGEELKQAYGSMLYLKQGQKVSLRSLLYGLMLRSGNDAAVEIATHVGKDVKTFVTMMNKKADDIGMLNTTFHNPSGLDEEDGGNISTAYDMALLMSYAMKNNEFRKITSTQYYTSEWNLRWKNKNRLLFDDAFVNGGKTGFTKKAGRTLVTSAKYKDNESIVVTLQTSDDFAFHKEKHHETFQKYRTLTLLKEGTYHQKHKVYQVTHPIMVCVEKNHNDVIQIHSHIEDNNMIYEVSKNNHVDVYSYPLQKERRHDS